MKQLLTILIFIFALPLSDVFAQHNEPLPNAVLKMDGGYSIKGNNVTAVDKTTLSTKNTSIPSSQAVTSKIKEAIGDSLELLPTYISNLTSNTKTNIYNDILPYKIYIARIYFDGTNAPVVQQVITNTFGISFTWQRVSAGNYQIVDFGNSPFTNNKTIGFVTLWGGSLNYVVNFTSPTSGIVAVVTKNPSTGTNTDLSAEQIVVEIRVYK